MECIHCEKSFSRFDLHVCPICHKQSCGGCSVSRGGKHFCSQFCAQYFFYGDGGEDEAEEIDE